MAGFHTEELRVLTNLQDKPKQHKDAHLYLGEANTDTMLFCYTSLGKIA
jgi:hypothetical protein